MQKEQHAREESLQQQAKKKTEAKPATSFKCSNCGTSHGANDKFCPECGMALGGGTCPHCGAATQPDQEICPECGGNLSAGLCSFCGGAMTPGESFCPECGNPRTGIVCGNCHTLNFRSFCRKCNSPLNGAAEEALAMARKDPKVLKAVAIARELEELEQILASFTEQEEEPPVLPEITAENKDLQALYKNLLDSFRGGEVPIVEPEPETSPEPPKPKPKFSVEIATKEEAMQKYREKMAEMQQTLSDMLPDAGLTPQMQRDFYCARKVSVRRPGKVYWECTAYGCLHDSPGECSKPWKGGVWKYVPDENIVYTYGGPS